ncbi:MAG: hypothetical protein Q9187_004721 [Circinaria calcarea]
MSGLSKNYGRAVQPWEVFDMIGGTSTGGLIAVMLGRLRMSIKDCESAYLKISERIFQPKRNALNKLGQAKDFLQANGRFDYRYLEAAIKEVLVDYCEKSEDELLKDPDPRCKVFVCATRKGNSGTAILRSYENDEPELLYDECKIWEACRATSAATTFFDSIKIGPYGQEFVDGAVLYNNPIELVHREAASTWPNRISDAILISVGTGSAPGPTLDGNIKHIVEALAKIVTQTEQTADNFYHGHERMVAQNLLYRFNVYHGLSDIGLEESQEKAKIADATQTYLMNGESRQKVRRCVEQLCEVTPQGTERNHSDLGA